MNVKLVGGGEFIGGNPHHQPPISLRRLAKSWLLAHGLIHKRVFFQKSGVYKDFGLRLSDKLIIYHFEGIVGASLRLVIRY